MKQFKVVIIDVASDTVKKTCRDIKAVDRIAAMMIAQAIYNPCGYEKLRVIEVTKSVND